MNAGNIVAILIVLSYFGFIIGFFLMMKGRNKFKKQCTSMYEKYKDIINLDEYKDKVTADTNKIIEEKNSEIKKLDDSIHELRNNYSEKHGYFEKLLHEISLYEDTEEIFSYGLYKPHFDFNTSEKYKNEIQKVRESQKLCIKNEDAAICTEQWTVNGSKAEGNKQTKRYIKLMLRAFNGECDAMIADVKWNNISKMEERLEKSFEAINKMGETHSTSITKKYKDLKLEELRLAFEYQEKLHQEKEEQRIIKEQMREEEKIQKEIEKKQKEIEKQRKEEVELQKKLKEAFEQGKQAEAEKYQAEINNLNQIIENSQRAISQAQQTKIGHVYIISNIGSFGENVYKIGMTRRLEPMERIDELGSASVPFKFDVHAMIKSDNAPELENSLHKYFDSKRVNLVNARKEFFYVTLDEIEEYAKKNNIDVEFTKLAEARDYRESMAIREAKNKKKVENEKVVKDIPNSI